MQRRAQRVRTKLRKVAEGRPRLSVARSHKNISAQIIDDEKGITLASASTLEKDVLGKAKTGADSAAAALVGKTLAERAKKASQQAEVSQASVSEGEKRRKLRELINLYVSEKITPREYYRRRDLILGNTNPADK